MATSFNSFEPLESRQMMSASASHGVLTITGTSGADVISVSQLSNGNVRVNDNGTMRTFSNFAVNQVRVNAGSGNDKVTIETSVTRPATIKGQAGNDTLTGSNRADEILGGGGNDNIDGRGGDDVLKGESGNDFVRGGSGNDRLYAGTGSGVDQLFGDSGNDILVSLGGGMDNAFGGTGSDSFWVDKTIPGSFFTPTQLGDITDASTGEKNLGALHEVSEFQQLKRVNTPIFDEQTQTPSRELAGQNLLDPNPVNALEPTTSSATYTNFSGRDLFADGAER